jgi:transcription elongation factor SPT6
MAEDGEHRENVVDDVDAKESDANVGDAVMTEEPTNPTPVSEAVENETSKDVDADADAAVDAAVETDVVPNAPGGGADDEEADKAADDAEDDEDEDEEAGIRRRRRKRAMQLDEEDYELLEDNQVTGFKRKEKKKRLQTAAEREGAVAGAAAKAPGTIEDLERGLFGDDDDDEEEAAEKGQVEGDDAAAKESEQATKTAAAEAPQQRQVTGYSDSEDEMDDFIVRDETDGPRETKEERARRYKSSIPGLRRDQIQDAADIFGDTEELHRMFARRARGQSQQQESTPEELSGDESSDAEEDAMDDFIENDNATQEDLDRAREARDARKAAKAAKAERRKSKSGVVAGDGWATHAFEPSVVKEQMLTQRDDVIRKSDLPERQQLKPRPEDAPTDWNAEAGWIFDRMMGRDSIQQKPTPEGYLLLYGWADYESENVHAEREASIQALNDALTIEEETEIVGCMALFLKLTFEDHLEVPYIVSQRRDDMLPLLRGRGEEARPEMSAEGENYKRLLRRFDILNAIIDWDGRYVKLEQRKSRVMSTLEAIVAAKGERAEGLVARQCADLVSRAYLERHVDDAEAKAVLFADNSADGNKRRPGRRTAYDTHVKKGLRDLIQHSGPTAATFGEDLANETPSEILASLTPEESAKVYLSEGYNTTDEVIAAFVNVAATEIAAEPAVRSWFREQFLGHATISTHPTPEGTDIIDPWHQLASVKRLAHIPVYVLTGEQFAYILEGKRRGLLKVDIGLSDEHRKAVVEKMEKAYLSENVSELGEAWNDVRRKVIQSALDEHLLPALTRETGRSLGLDARDALARFCAEGAWNFINSAPWRPANMEDNDIEVRVIAAVSGSPATFVALDSTGELMDFIQCHTIGRSLGGPRGGGGQQMMNQQDEIQALMDFVVHHRPHVCVVSGSGMDSKRVKETMNLVVGRILEEQPRAIPEEVSEIAVHFVDDTVAKLCEQATATKAEMPEQQPSVLRAVALGRTVQNPAAVVASLVSGGEVAALPMCPMQESVLSKDDRIAIVEQQLVTLVNQVGVDINMVSAHPWCHVLVRYIGGLGPRKATNVLNAVRANDGGVVDSRADLKGVMGDIVFRNAAASIRITDADMLDSIRCHPENYDHAIAIVVNALDVQEQMMEMEKYEREKILSKVFEPKTWELKVAPLILEEYADYLQSVGAGKLLEVLREIRVEFRYPFEELRQPWRALSAEEEFALLSGESTQTLSAGKLIQCTVKKVEGPRDGRGARAVCTLDSGLVGYVDKYDISDDSQFDRLEEKVAPGQVITARIKPDGIDVYNFTVQLSCKGSVLSEQETRAWEQHLHATEANAYYSMDVQPGEVREKKKKKKDKRPEFIPRNIDHPNFENIGFLSAKEKLETAEIGDFIIRPSGKGTKNLSCTMKVYDEVCRHIDIKETKTGSVNNLALGTPLIIDGEEYEDLDEVVARYIEPMISHIKHMLRHRKFMRGRKDEIDAALQQQLARQPNVRPYALGVSHDNPGLFCISFILSSSGNVHHEYIQINPAGFRFRKMEFPSVDRMLAYFKVNCAKPPPGYDALMRDNGGWN